MAKKGGDLRGVTGGGVQCFSHAVALQGYLAYIRDHHPVGPYRKTMPRLLWRSQGGGGDFLWARYPCSSTAYLECRLLDG